MNAANGGDGRRRGPRQAERSVYALLSAIHHPSMRLGLTLRQYVDFARSLGLPDELSCAMTSETASGCCWF